MNVLQTDTDVAWLASPYPLLKTHFANHSLVVQHDAPLVNAGVIYVQNAREGSGAAWLLQELARRVHLFMWNPEAVAAIVPWAKRPFFANADEQTIMNVFKRTIFLTVSSVELAPMSAQAISL